MISTETSRKSYIGNGSTTVFDYGFKIFANTDLAVYVDNVLKTLTTDYTVSGVGLESGTRNVTFLSAPASGAKIEIFRSVALKQLADYVANDNFPAQTHEDTLDKIVQQIQMLKDLLRKVPMLGLGTADKDISLANPVANSPLQWDATGKIITTGMSPSAKRVFAQVGSDQTIPGSATTKIALNSKVYDVLDEFDAVTNYRFTASAAGGYLVVANVRMDFVGTSGNQIAYIQRTIPPSSTTYIARQRTGMGTGEPGHASLSTIIEMAVSDYLELFVENKASGNVTIPIGTKMEITRLW